MWPTQKNRSGHSEPWTPGMGKPVVPDEWAEPQTAQLSAEKSLLASPVHAVKKAVCVLCSEPTDESICGACADKVRAEAVEHKRWEEKGGH